MVFWRDWKGWLKGGIIYTLVVTGLYFLGRWLYNFVPLLGKILVFPFSWSINILFSLINQSNMSFTLFMSLFYIIAIIQSFIVGAFIGFVIHKVIRKANY